MPSAPSPGSHAPRFTTLDRAQRVRFRRAVTLMLMTLVLPGSAQLVAGRRRLGLVALRTWLGLVVFGLLAVTTSYVWNGVAFWAGTDTTFLQVLRLGMMAIAVGWAYLFVDAWRLGQPLTLQRQHRLAIVGVNGFLCFSVAGALLFGAHVVGVQRQFMISMFGDGAAVGAHHGRYNVLLLGGDSGAGRWGLRPDSMTVASIDAETGKTVLISLPRNMQNFPFAEGSVLDKQFPDGFDVEGMYLNSVSTWALDHAELFAGSKSPGVDATIMGVEGITGLKMNYWAMVNLEGFKDLVDAVGGVELNVRQPIPVGLPHEKTFHYIEAGTRTLEWSRHAVVRPCPRGLRRLLAHGAAEVRDERDAPAGQPTGGAAQLRGDRRRERGHGLHRHPARRGRPVRGPRAQGPQPEDRDPLPRPADDQHRRPRHRARAAKVRRRIDRSEGQAGAGDRRGGSRRAAGRTAATRGLRATPAAPATPSETPTPAPVAPPSVTGGSLGSLARATSPTSPRTSARSAEPADP